MRSDDLKLIDGAVAGSWIEPRLEGEVGSVTSLVPRGFEAYARIFHPASDTEGKPVRWTEVANALGKTAHREMQWHALVESSDTAGMDGSRWTGGIPSLGEMDIETLNALCELLTDHTADPDRCFFGLCTIQGWEGSFTAEELTLPYLELPLERDHIVLAGPLSAVGQIENDGLGFGWRDAPNLIWPADHSWFIASEVDFDSTLIGGGAKLIEAIVEYPELEAMRVKPTDSLTEDADLINGAKR